jgi:hypothetical protein
MVWILIPFFAVVISDIAYAQQQQPDPVSSTTEIHLHSKSMVSFVE